MRIFSLFQQSRFSHWNMRIELGNIDMVGWMDTKRKWNLLSNSTNFYAVDNNKLLFLLSRHKAYEAQTHRTDMLVQFCAPYLCDKRKWKVAYSQYGCHYIHAWDWPFPYILGSVQYMNNVCDVTFCNIWQKEYQVCKTWKNNNNSWSNKILMQSTCSIQQKKMKH